MKSVLIAAVSAFAFCASARAADAQEFPVVLFPFREATVASAVDSELEEYLYKVGEAFTNGAVVAELNDERYRVNFLRAREHRDFSARVAKEQRELRAKDFASEMELRKAEYEAKIAEADFAEAEINLRRCSLTAPFRGKIAEMITQRYETVKPGQPLFRIIEDGCLLAAANLPVGFLSVGENVTVVPDGRDPVPGTVYEISPQADNRTGTVRVRIRVDNADGRLTAGMTGVLVLSGASAGAAGEDGVAASNPTLINPGIRYMTVAEAFKGVSSVTAGQASPAVEIAGVSFDGSKLTYALRRSDRAVSISTLKRIGEFAAGVYDADGVRVSCVDTCQIPLPASGGTITNTAAFPPFPAPVLSCRPTPYRLVLRVESDIRSCLLDDEGYLYGGN